MAPKEGFWVFFGGEAALAVAPGGLRGQNVKMGKGNTFDFFILFSVLHRLFTGFFGFFRDFRAL